MTLWDFLYKALYKLYSLMQSDTAKALLCTLIGSLFTLLLQALSGFWKNRGKLKIYYNNCRNKVFRRTACFHIEHSINKINCYLPLEIDMVNTSGKNKIVRHLSAVAMLGDKQIEIFNPIRSAGRKPAEMPITQEGLYGTIFTSYSYMIPAHNCIHSELLFLIQGNSVEAEKYCFDHIDLVWYDERDKKHRSTIAKLTECWKDGNIDISLDPQLLTIY